MIRTATVDDLQSVVELENTFGAEAFSRRSLRHLIKTSIFLVYEKTEILAYASVVLRSNSKKARLYSIAVSEKSRGSGIGKSLLEACEKAALGSGKTIMSLEVSVNNQPAKNLYAKRGYVKKKVLKAYYEDETDAFRLEKKLCTSSS